jgi:hypothetical protein
MLLVKPLTPLDRETMELFGVASFLKASSWIPQCLFVSGGLLALAVRLPGGDACLDGV